MLKETESQIETIREIFTRAKTEDNWNLDEPMLYSFYFADENIEKLEKLGLHLENEGYDFIGIFEAEDEETGKVTGEFLLHIDKVEAHTPESLAAENARFEKLADEYEIKDYDGWEVGEIGDEEDDEDEEE